MDTLPSMHASRFRQLDLELAYTLMLKNKRKKELCNTLVCIFVTHLTVKGVELALVSVPFKHTKPWFDCL